MNRNPPLSLRLQGKNLALICCTSLGIPATVGQAAGLRCSETEAERFHGGLHGFFVTAQQDDSKENSENRIIAVTSFLIIQLLIRY